MTNLPFILPGFALILLAGCGTVPEPEPARVETNAPAPVPEPLIIPLDASVGRIVAVNARLRFVVVDYSLYTLPAQGQRLSVLRDETEIGELRVNGPVVDATVVADIVRGEPRPGDRTRPKSGSIR